MIRLLLLCLAWLAVAVAQPALAKTEPPLVLAAASLQEAMNDAADAFAAKKHPRPVISFAATSALARQIEAGAPADMFVSADEDWMDYVEQRGLIRPRSRIVLVRNRLAVIAAPGERASFSVGRGMLLARALGDRKLAMADPDSVPAGKYGKAALTRLGVWRAVEANIASAENVRAALALVERGAAPFGIVYATDARASPSVRLVGLFPANSHPPINYPVAITRRSNNLEAEFFRRFLVSPEGRAILEKRGFSAP